jgi:hypothetical protein
MPDEYSDRSDTLDDMKRKDIDNLENLMKGRVFKTFPNKVAVTRFVSAMVFGTLEKIGMNMNPNMTGEQAEAFMRSQGIKIEPRPAEHYQGEDAWRAGTYIYKHNEIVTFIGGARLNLNEGQWELWAASRVMKIDTVVS